MSLNTQVAELLVRWEELRERGDTQITDAGLENLQRMQHLQDVSLADTGITDAGLERLQGLKQLVKVDLKGTKVTADGVRKLHAALPHCKIEAAFPDALPDKQKP